MAKKFFKKKVYSRKKRNITIFLVLFFTVLGIILSLYTIYHFNSKKVKDGIAEIKDEISHEINSSTPEKHVFFYTLEGIKDKYIKVDYSKVNFKKLGSYPVKIKIFKNTYRSKINIIDVSAPILKLKPLSININEGYSLNDFVESCTDNSREDCILNYYYEKDTKGNIIHEYENITKEGTYEVKIIAKDKSNNEVVKSTTLKIGSVITETSCDYGSINYETTKNLAGLLTINDCAINPDLYESDTIKERVLSLASTETKKIQMEINKLPNLKDSLTINRLANPILNTEGKGLVGFSLHFEITDRDGSVVVSYYLLEGGKRLFINNPYQIKN